MDKAHGSLGIRSTGKKFKTFNFIGQEEGNLLSPVPRRHRGDLGGKAPHIPNSALVMELVNFTF
jgi:hypothetical protein